MLPIPRLHFLSVHPRNKNKNFSVHGKCRGKDNGRVTQLDPATCSIQGAGVSFRSATWYLAGIFGRFVQPTRKCSNCNLNLGLYRWLMHAIWNTPLYDFHRCMIQQQMFQIWIWDCSVWYWDFIRHDFSKKFFYAVFSKRKSEIELRKVYRQKVWLNCSYLTYKFKLFSVRKPNRNIHIIFLNCWLMKFYIFWA